MDLDWREVSLFAWISGTYNAKADLCELLEKSQFPSNTYKLEFPNQNLIITVQYGVNKA